MPRKKIEGICKVEDCTDTIRAKGYCNKHYLKYHKTLSDYRPNDKSFNDKRNHPYYVLWWHRKQNNLLCEAWLDFSNFVWGIGTKPKGNFLLLQIDGSKPFGPDNFRWQEHLKRKEGESKSDWWARKRAARIFANPSMESDRNLKRNFNLTREQYNEKLKNQNFVCAICNQPETATSRTGGTKGLAVDHCHTSKGIRELLCWRCNSTLGKVNDSADLLKKMIEYLNKHNKGNI